MVSLIKNPFNHICEPSFCEEGFSKELSKDEIESIEKDVRRLSSVGKIIIISAGMFGLIAVPTTSGIPFIGKILATTAIVSALGICILGCDCITIAQNLAPYTNDGLRNRLKEKCYKLCAESNEMDPRTEFLKELVKIASKGTVIGRIIINKIIH